MSTTAAALTVVAILAVTVPAAYWQIRRAMRHDAARDRIIRAACAYDGAVAANDPRLPAGINAHLDDYAALDPDLAPVFAPGIDRLRQAIRDEQQEGEQP